MVAPSSENPLKPYKLVHGKKNAHFGVVNKEQAQFTRS